MSFARRDLPPPDAALLMRYDANKRSALLAYALWFFLGYFGVHRFYLNRWASGFALLALMSVSTLLAGVLIGLPGLALVFLWWLVDALLVPGMVDDYNNRLIATLR